MYEYSLSKHIQNQNLNKLINDERNGREQAW